MALFFRPSNVQHPLVLDASPFGLADRSTYIAGRSPRSWTPARLQGTSCGCEAYFHNEPYLIHDHSGVDYASFVRQIQRQRALEARQARQYEYVRQLRLREQEQRERLDRERRQLRQQQEWAQQVQLATALAPAASRAQVQGRARYEYELEQRRRVLLAERERERKRSAYLERLREQEKEQEWIHALEGLTDGVGAFMSDVLPLFIGGQPLPGPSRAAKAEEQQSTETGDVEVTYTGKHLATVREEREAEAQMDLDDVQPGAPPTDTQHSIPVTVHAPSRSPLSTDDESTLSAKTQEPVSLQNENESETPLAKPEDGASHAYPPTSPALSATSTRSPPRPTVEDAPEEDEEMGYEVV